MMWAVVTIALVVVNIGLQALDVWTTLVVLADGGTEGNPWSAWVMDAFGVRTWVVIKALFMGALAGVAVWAWSATTNENQKATMAAGFVAIWMGGVVMNNLRVMGVF